MAGQVKKLIHGEGGTLEVVIEAGDLDLSELPMQIAVRIGGTSITLHPGAETRPGLYRCIIQPKWKDLAESICVPGATVELDQ